MGNSVAKGCEVTSPTPTVVKSEAEWRSALPPAVFAAAREGRTDAPQIGAFTFTMLPGEYSCACCGAALFGSEHKFASGCGWPSFSQPVAGAVRFAIDDSSDSGARTAVRCRACEAHLGHVFDDGPKESGGLRYCINSACLKFVERGSESAASELLAATAAAVAAVVAGESAAAEAASKAAAADKSKDTDEATAFGAGAVFGAASATAARAAQQRATDAGEVEARLRLQATRESSSVRNAARADGAAGRE